MKRKLISFILLVSLSLTAVGCNIPDFSTKDDTSIISENSNNNSEDPSEDYSKIKFDTKDDDKLKTDRDEDSKYYTPFSREELLKANKEIYDRLHNYFSDKSFTEKIDTISELKDDKKFCYRYEWVSPDNTDFSVNYDSVIESKDEAYLYVKTFINRDSLKVDDDNNYSFIKDLYKNVTTKDLSEDSLNRLKDVINDSNSYENSEIDHYEVRTISEEGNFGMYMTIGYSSYEIIIQSVLNS